MPKLFKIGSYWVYFWANENQPLEPVHVHISQGAPNPGATKVWITRREDVSWPTIIPISLIISCAT